MKLVFKRVQNIKKNIKIFYSLLIATCLILSACSHVPERHVQRDETASKNIFVSEKDPDITIKPNSDFIYIGSKELYDKGSRDTQYVEKMEQYTYIYVSQGKAKRILVVKFCTIIDDSYTFLSDFFSFRIKGILARGTELLSDGNKYGYCIGTMTSEYDDTSMALVEKGYLLPECLMVKEMGRIYSEKYDKKILISYYEDIDDTGIDCSDWQWGLGSKEKKYFIEGFIKRSKEAFYIANKD